MVISINKSLTSASVVDHLESLLTSVTVGLSSRVDEADVVRGTIGLGPVIVATRLLGDRKTVVSAKV